MSHLPARRLPLQPLLDLAETTTFDPANGERDSTQTVLAELMHVTKRSIVRWKIAGIPEPQADRAACAIGLHPASVWADWYADELSVA